MAEYANYEFYQNSYKGSLSANLFNSLIAKASREIDSAVNRKLVEADISYDIKFVACELVDFLKNDSNSKASSISIDGVSKSIISKDEIEKEKRKILNKLPHELIRFL